MSDIELRLNDRFHKSGPYISLLSLLTVIGTVIAILHGGVPSSEAATVSPQITVQQITKIEDELNDHAQKLADGRADIEGLKHDSATYKSDMEDLRTQVGKLNDKSDRQLELTMRMMQNLQAAAQAGHR